MQIDGFAVFLGFVDNPRDTVLGTTSKIIFGQKNNLSQNDGDALNQTPSCVKKLLETWTWNELTDVVA